VLSVSAPLTIRPSSMSAESPVSLYFFRDRPERAFLAVVAELNVLHVIGDRIEPFGFRHHLVRRRKDKFGIFVDELLDQPWTSNAIDLDLPPS
jgi:hypothetical protein